MRAFMRNYNDGKRRLRMACTYTRQINFGIAGDVTLNITT